jgi:glucosamine--fructose-6-phosphate aminotransferase (isomerizing)
MCGIVGILGRRPVAERLIEGLKRLEYRGYDSAGIATVVGRRLERRRASGKLGQLEALLATNPLPGRTGIGHTRWATHGPPNETNAHPQATSRVAVVHNGIIENYRELKDELTAAGCRFESETDTEVVAQLLTRSVESGLSPPDAMAAAMRRLEGVFALATILSDDDDVILVARRGCALAIGYGDGEMFVGSDALALAPLTRRVAYLEEGDWAVVTRGGADIRDRGGRPVERPIRETEVSGALVGKGNYRHFMEKEIYEQPEVIGDTLQYYYNPARRRITLPDFPFALADIPRATVVAAGTSFYAGMMAKFWLERVARLPTEVDIASEFRYRQPELPEGGLALFISQSGETLDTLEALRYARSQRQRVAALINVPESTMAREADVVLRTYAGPEIGVASTKAFTTQLSVLACLTLAVGRARKKIDAATLERIADQLVHLPALTQAALDASAKIKPIAEELAECRDVLYLGRGASFPIALEGALKLKEISYIHAEGYAAGEMKHGPIALIAEGVPVIVVAPSDELFAKTASNIQEVRARGGRAIVLTDQEGAARLDTKGLELVVLPKADPLVAPILFTIPVQLLAYHAAVAKGTDVDRPRNLAKSVTVE